jgi:hypothetical protein
MAAPGPAASGAGKPARAGGEFILHRHRSANRSGSRDVSLEPHKVGMCQNSVIHIDGEVVARIAAALLRDERDVPGPIIGRSCLRGTRHRNESAGRHRAKPRTFHEDFSKAWSGRNPNDSREPEPGCHFGKFGAKCLYEFALIVVALLTTIIPLAAERSILGLARSGGRGMVEPLRNPSLAREFCDIILRQGAHHEAQ